MRRNRSLRLVAVCFGALLAAACDSSSSYRGYGEFTDNGEGAAAERYVVDFGRIDLGKITIDGDLAKIVAGDADTTTSGLRGLSAESLGRVLFASGAVFPDLHSIIQGSLETLKIKRDIFGADIEVQGGTNGRIGSISIGGSLIGLDASNSGGIVTSGARCTAY